MPAMPFPNVPSPALQAVVALGLAIAALTPAAPVAAQGVENGRTSLAAGPYLVDVAVSQDRGDVHFIITVQAASTGEAVSDATVQVLAEREDAALRRTSQAKRTAPGRYQADMEFATLGRWKPTVTIVGPLGDGTVALPPLELSAPSGSVAGAYLLYGIVAAIAGGAVYLWWSARREQRKQQPAHHGGGSDEPPAGWRTARNDIGSSGRNEETEGT